MSSSRTPRYIRVLPFLNQTAADYPFKPSLSHSSNSETPIQPIKMAFRYLKPEFSSESDIHFMNIRFEYQDITFCDFMLLHIMRNQINLRTAVVTMWCPMAAGKAGIASIKIKGKYDNEDQVFDQALEMVHRWQKENGGCGNFIFDRGAIWKHPVPKRPYATRTPKMGCEDERWTRRRSAALVSLPTDLTALRISRPSWRR